MLVLMLTMLKKIESTIFLAAIISALWWLCTLMGAFFSCTTGYNGPGGIFMCQSPYMPYWLVVWLLATIFLVCIGATMVATRAVCRNSTQ